MDSKLYRNSFFTNNTLIVVLASVLLISACLINTQTKKPVISLSKQETAININTKFLSILSGGHKRLITDLLWTQTLIESDTEHYKKKDLNSWLFLRFNTISILDPKFYENYAYGGQFLAIIKDDLEGADAIYDKGLGYYPNDYSLNYQAGFMNYYEIGNFKKGYKYLNRVIDDPKAPSYLRSIISKISYEVSGDLTETYKLVQYNHEVAKDENLKQRLWSDLYAIKAEIDLKCLNNNGSGCAMKDEAGELYQKRGHAYYSVRPFSKYGIKIRGENKSPPQNQMINTIK
jgi:hypothetical protein